MRAGETQRRDDVVLNLAPPREREPIWPLVLAGALGFGVVFALIWLVLRVAAFVFTFGTESTVPTAPALLLASIFPAGLVLMRVLHDLAWRRAPQVRLTETELQIAVPTWRTMKVARSDVRGFVIEPNLPARPQPRLGEPVPSEALFNSADRPNAGILFARPVEVPIGNLFIAPRAGVSLPANGALLRGMLVRFEDPEEARAAFERWGIAVEDPAARDAFTYDPRSVLRGWRLAAVAAVVFAVAAAGVVAVVSAVRS